MTVSTYHHPKFSTLTERSVFTSRHLKSILAIGGLILVFPLMLNSRAGVPLYQPKTLEPLQETASWKNDTDTLEVEAITKGKVMFHMGVHKTGTTSIQHALNSQTFKDSLMEDNFIVGNVDLGGPTKSALAKCFENKQSCSSSNGHSSTIAKRIEEALVGNHNLVLSSEQFDYYRVATKIKSFFHEFDDVQVILFYRRFFEWSLSMYMQSKRNGWNKSWESAGSSGNRKNFVTFLASRNISSYVMEESRYTVSTYNYYKKHFNVSLVNLHAGNGDSLTNFLCNPAFHAPNTCKKRQRNELQVGRSNQVSGKEVYDEIAMAAYAKGLIDVQKYSRDTARSLIQKHQESYLNQTVADFSVICPPLHQLDELLEVSIKVEREYFPDFFESEQGEAELRKKFHKMVSRFQFCSVDTERVLADRQWKNYFAQW